MSVSAEKRTYMKADERRRQILECARRVFASQGFHVTSVADICSEAGIGRGTLYQYFGNKRDVFLAVLNDVAGRVATVLEERPRIAEVEGADHAPAPLALAFCRKRLRELLDAVFVDEASLRLLWRDAHGVDGGVDQIVRTVDELVRDALVADLGSARAMGIIDCEDLELTALFIMGGIQKMVLDALERDAPLDLDRIVRVATHLEFMGLLSERTRGSRPAEDSPPSPLAQEERR
jgi:AcrR family transcriptional regulator